MSHQVIRLKAGDFDDLMVFLGEAFGHGPTWFHTNLPTIYQPTDEDMANNFAIRVDGRLAAVVGVFPATMICGDRPLKHAGIGGVSTGRDFRRLGLMKRVMDHVVQAIREEGYALSYLGGQRQRYRYWGWERTGLTLRARLCHANLRHEPTWQRIVPLSLRRVEANDPCLPAMQALHDQRPRRMSRPRFADHLVEWSGQPMVGVDVDDQVAAYGCMRAGKSEIDDLTARDADAALGFVRAAIEVEKHDQFLFLDPVVEPALQPLIDMAEVVSLEESGNWQIFDWPAVTEALLRLSMRRRPLLDGRVVLEAQGHAGVRFEISVERGNPACHKTNATPHLSADACLLTRALFGPLSPSQVLAVPPRAAILEQWCPLPLFLSHQDCV